MIGTPDVPPRRTDWRLCDHCGASAGACRSVAWLRGEACCKACDQSGTNHDNPSTTNTKEIDHA